MSFFSELKRRNVFKVVAAYAVVSWIVLQLGAIAFPALNLPNWTMTMLIVFILIGLPFVIIFAWAFELTPDGLKPTKKVSVEESIAPSTGQNLNITIIAGLVVALLLLGVYSFVLDKPSTVLDPDIEKSIAVLPFADLSPEGDQEYFADGISEELLNKLAKIQDLKVAARTSSFYYKGRNENMKDIGATLGVAYILEGSVRKSANQLRITAQLIKAEDGYHLWSETYDRDLEDIFAVQDEIAIDVSTALSITLSAGEFDRPGMTSNVQAYEEYLQGVESAPGTRLEKVAHLEDTLKIDPNFGLAWIALQTAYNNGRIGLAPAESLGFDQLSIDALEQARRLIPETPEFIVANAEAERRAGNWLESERLYLLALEEAGNSNELANLYYGEMLWSVGRVRDALPYLQRAKRISPLLGTISQRLAAVLLSMGNTQEAIDEADRGDLLNSDPNGFLGYQKAMAYSVRGDWTALKTEFSKITGSNEETFLITEAIEAGDMNRALEILRPLSDLLLPPTANTALSHFAALTGDSELSLKFLSPEVNSNANDIFGSFPIWQSFMSDVRKQEGFKTLARDSGLEEYWRATNNWGDFCQPVNNDDFECF